MTQAGLDRIARATGRFEDLAQTLRDLAVKQADATIASQLYVAGARVYENDVGNLDVATSLYQRVLEIDPSNLGAAEALEALSRRTNKYPELSLILQRKSEIVETFEAKKEALFQAAAIEEDVLERPETAIAVYNRGPRAGCRRSAFHRRAHQALPRALALGGPARCLCEEGRPRLGHQREEEHLLPGGCRLRARAR